MRKLYALAIVVATLFTTSAIAQHAFLDQGVLDNLDSAGENELIPLLILVENSVDIATLKAEFIINNTPVNERAKLVMQALKSRANDTQPAIIEFIQSSELAYAELQQFWIGNHIAIEACPALVNQLSYREDIEQIGLNSAAFSLITPHREGIGAPKLEGGHEIGLEAIGAPTMWAMGYTGNGRIALTFDTGVQPDHPAHRDRFLPNLLPLESTWYPYDSALPNDKPGSHGTHVSGIMLGLDTATADTIGVAPQAYFIATDPIVEDIANVQTLSALMLGYEWAMNPDGDEDTSSDIPDVINNSWGRANDIVDQEWNLCSEFVVDVMDAVLAAGIANVFSAGNEGPGDATIGIPHNINTGLVNSFTVAAISGINLNVAPFSSRGPSLCGGEGSILIKPEVSAPGISVRSSVQHDEYDLFSGTSMAAPHVAGAILLLKEAFPYLSGEELQLALYFSAIDLGNTGEDNTYGMGIINLGAAFDYLSENNIPVPPAVLEKDLVLISIDSPTSELDCPDTATPEALPVITVKNNGVNAVDSYNIKYSISGAAEQTYAVTESLAAGATTQINLPALAYNPDGLSELHIYIEELEDEYDVFNNHRTIRWNALNSAVMSQSIFSEDFTDGIETNLWTITNPDGAITWDTAEVLQIDNTTGTAAWMNHTGYEAILSQKDGLITPILSEFDAGTSFNLSFDLFYHKRSSNALFHDTLRVFLNDGCDNRTMVWEAGGADLYTVDAFLADAFPITSDDWASKNILLGELSEEKFYLTFETSNRRGNNLLIDNILISQSSDVASHDPVDFELYPNPSQGSLKIKPNATQKVDQISISDIQGRQLLIETSAEAIYTFDLSEYAPGVYMVTVKYESGQQHTEKLVIE